MRTVRQIMGMPIVVDIQSCENRAVFETVFRHFNKIDRRFSPYKKTSEVFKFRAGGIAATKLSPDLKQIIKACRAAEKQTNGYFSAWAAGSFDPSGYVKGWAINQAGKIIEEHGYKAFCISAGGDILCRSDSHKVWNLGLQDPTNSKKIINKLKLKNGAVATSGSYERGAHITNPKTSQPANELLSATVIGPDIIWADVLATACFAMGKKAQEFMKSQADYKAILILPAVAGEVISHNV